MALDIHPQDLGLWIRIIPVAWDTARAFKLPLRELIPTPLPGRGIYKNQEALGCCWPREGIIHIALRFKDAEGKWLGPRPEPDVWKTLAHELAHLEEDRHSTRFWALHENILAEINNSWPSCQRITGEI